MRPLLGAGDFPFGVTFSLNKAGFHLPLNVYDTIRADVFGESPCAPVLYLKSDLEVPASLGSRCCS